MTQCPEWVEPDIAPLLRSSDLLQVAPVERRSIFIRGVWAACLLIAGINHARLLVQHGFFWDYRGLNPISAAYQTSLTFIDPLVAALLFIRPKVGIIATIVLIVTNVMHNLAVTAYFAPAGEFFTRASHPILLAQIGFMLFVAATTRSAWLGVVREGDVRPERPQWVDPGP